VLNEKEIACILIANDCIRQCDVIVFLEGDGANRISQAVKLYQEGFSNKIVFSGGAENLEYGSFPYSMLKSKFIENGVLEEHILLEGKSQHTKEQAVEFVKMAKKNKWTSFLLVASHFHQYRAYVTFLKEILVEYPSLIMINASANNLWWHEENRWGKRFDLLSDEFEKIDKYCLSDHVATWKEVIDYHQWKEKELQLPKLKKS
jgi:uncharacterized SAM-binding protein YcdF (DUF218 family)